MRLLALLALAAVAEAGSPVGKVLQLLGSLQKKVENEGKDSQREHKEFSEFCRSQSQDLEHSISRNNDKISDVSAINEKANSEIERLSATIADVSAKISGEEGDLADAKSLRAEQKASYEKGQKDLEDTIDALVRANGILRKRGLGLLQSAQMKSVLAQVTTTLSTIMDAAIIDGASRSKLQSLLESGEEEEDFKNPEAKAYESHSKNIIEILEDLKVKAEGELSDLRKEEMERQHKFDMLQQGLTDSIDTANRDRKNDQNSLAQNEETKGKSAGDLASEKDSLSQNSAQLKDTNEKCAQRNEDYAAEVKSRSEELAAFAKATEILSDPKFAASNAAVAGFLQVRDARGQAVDVIRQASREFRSVALAQLAVRASEDTFGKVKGLIREMMNKLKKQAAQESDHNAYCEEEKKNSEAKRDDIQGKHDNFDARLEKAQSNSAELKQDVADLSADVANMDSNVAKATKVREEEASTYAKASEDFRVGLDGLQKATQVLREYYSVGGAHKKASDSSSGIIGMLEVAEQDMSNSSAQSEIQEANAIKDFKKMMQEAATNKASMQASVKAKEAELARLKGSISDLQNDFDGAAQELKSVLNYLAKLRGQCTHKPQSFADRAAAMQREIASLKDALKILENDTSEFFLQRK